MSHDNLIYNDDNLIYYDDLKENHHYIFEENKLFGIIDAQNQTVVEPKYIEIKCFSLRSKIGRKYKNFYVLKSTDYKWTIFNISKNTFLPQVYVSMHNINQRALLMDENKAFWKLDFDTENTIPAIYDNIYYAFRHKELNPKKDLYFKEYSDTYFENFVSKFVKNERDKKIIKNYCWRSIEEPKFIYYNLLMAYNDRKDLEAIVIANYIIAIINSYKKITKKDQKILASTYLLMLQIYLDQPEEGIKIYKKIHPFIPFLGNRDQYRVYHISFEFFKELDMDLPQNFIVEAKQLYENLRPVHQKEFKEDYQEIINYRNEL